MLQIQVGNRVIEIEKALKSSMLEAGFKNIALEDIKEYFSKSYNHLTIENFKKYTIEDIDKDVTENGVLTMYSLDSKPIDIKLRILGVSMPKNSSYADIHPLVCNIEF